MVIFGREEQRRGPIRVLLVDKGLRALCRQQRANLSCITIMHSFPKLLPRHSFLFHLPAPPFCFVSLFTCNSHSLATCFLLATRMDKCAPNALICKQGLAICQTMTKPWYPFLSRARSHSRTSSLSCSTPLRSICQSFAKEVTTCAS